MMTAAPSRSPRMIPRRRRTAGNPGQFTVTRTAPTNVALTVNLTIAGTATNTTDYATVAATSRFRRGELPPINITPVDDCAHRRARRMSRSRSPPAATTSARRPSTTSPSPTTTTRPPSSSAALHRQGPLVANGNGVIVTAKVSDDGAPAAVTPTWSGQRPGHRDHRIASRRDDCGDLLRARNLCFAHQRH